MKDEFQRKAWALLIVLTSVVAAAAIWTLPEDTDFNRDIYFPGDSRTAKT